MSRIGVLVFDLDDTLYRERDFVLSGFRAVDEWLSRHESLSGFADEAIRLFAAGKRRKIFDEALTALGVPRTEKFVSRLVEIYREHRPHLQLLPDAYWAIERFRAGRKLGLITDGFSATQRNKVAALGIEPRFDELIYTDDFGRDFWKPHPRAFLRIMERFGCEAAQCVYVADNPRKDFAAPNQLGWMTVRIRREGGEHARLRDEAVEASHRAHWGIDSLIDLEQFLGRL